MRKALWLPGTSRGTLAALLLAAPVVAHASGFAGSSVVVRGNPTISSSGNTQTITLPTSSPVTTINWTPTDTATGGGPINFLPTGQTVSYVGTTGATVPYTVLNRIIPTDQTRSIAFNGTVDSTANTRVWFYSPGGLLIGATAQFDVGGLVLTTADPVLNGNASFITTSGGTDSFGFAGVAGSTSAITIQPGASISALNSGQSNYIVAFAPQINQGGKIAVAGSVALVAAESASFAVDTQGLFNITVSAGTTVAANTFVHTGSTGGPNADTQGNYQRVYMVAVPKNNAISMAIASSGSIGFAVADAANVDGNTIVLSAGSNITDTGTGNPVVAGRAGAGAASLTVGGGNYTSNTYAVSTDLAMVTDPALNLGFASNLTVIAPQATVQAQAGTIAVSGNLSIDADDTLTGNGGTASLMVGAGSITVGGDALVSATGSWGGGTQNPGNAFTRGGTAQVSVIGGQLSIGGTLTVNAIADATGANAALSPTASPYFDEGSDAFGGSASVIVSGAGATLTATGGIAASGSAIGSADQFNEGGFANAGTALIEAQSGGAISVGRYGAIAAAASGSPTGSEQPNNDTNNDESFGGSAMGGTAQIIANAGSISVAGLNGITAFANANGESAYTENGSGGSATGGTALIATQGASGSITTNTLGLSGYSTPSSGVEADAFGGSAVGNGFAGGKATGGSATLQVTSAGQSIAFDYGNSVTIETRAIGGAGAGNGGGNAIGGSAQLLVSGGSIAVTNAGLSINSSASGGTDNDGTGGTATGGMVQLATSNGGSVNAPVDSFLYASATGGSSEAGAGGAAAGGTVQLMATGSGAVTLSASPYFGASATGGSGSGTGGSALGGNILITMGNNALNFDAAASGAPELDASYTPGSSEGGPVPTSSTAGGVMLTDLGTLNLAGGLSIDGNTQFYVQAGGSINVPGSITGTGAGAYLHLVADDLGAGTGTVTLASGALSLPGNLIDIYYNPTSLGTPTDFSAGVHAGTWTGYQLVNTIDQLQLVGSYASQNFALGKNIDASATQGWNSGAGFVPIGDFDGNFDGLGHTITSLYENTQNSGGLFDLVGNGVGANIVIRNVGLISPQISGGNATGGLIGLVGSDNASDNVLISNTYVTGGAVTGSGVIVGGLIGELDGAGLTLTNSHSDTAVKGSSVNAGGLVGESSAATLTDVFATGSVTTNFSGAEAGGLIGFLSGGSLTNAYSTGAVSVGAGNYVGGLIGFNSNGAVSRVYSTGSVTAGPGTNDVGGLVGYNAGTITESWVSGSISAPSSAVIGGFVGLNQGTITNSYWDTYSTGQANDIGTNAATVTNLDSVTSDPAQTGSQSYAFYQNAYSNFTRGDWTYDNYQTRPVGAWETPVAQFGVATIESAHQVQLIDFNMAGNYTVTQNIDMSGTTGTTDIWGPGGFMPLGGEYVDPPFTGTLAGGGHVLSNLSITTNGDIGNAGLIQENYGTIRDLGLSNISIVAAFQTNVGALAGINAGHIIDSFATGTITLSNQGVAGGLVGTNADSTTTGTAGSITQSYASVAVSRGDTAGGLVGDNEGAITGSYANGAVSGAQTGGLVGESIDTAGPWVTNSYWDTQLSGQSAGCGSVGFSAACSGATGLTTAQTLQAASFVGFTIDPNGGQGLPWRQYEGDTTPLLEAFLTPISVQPGSLTTQYNTQVPDVGVTTYGAQLSQTFGTAVVNGLTRNAGVAYATYGGGLYSTQLGYDFAPSSNPGTVIVTPAPLTLSASSDSRVYNATTVSNTGDGVSVSGILGDDSVSNRSQSFASPNVLGTNGSTIVVDPGYVINDGNGGNNYTVTLQSARGTITAAPLAITYTANPATSTYGNTPSGLSGTVEEQGLQGSDTLASVTSGTAAFTTAATARSNVGSYAITGSGLAGDSGNYTFSFVQAAGNATALTIVAADLTVDVLANAESRSYGTANPALTYTETGLANGDTLTGSLATTATISSNVGVYAITQGTLSAGSNYILNYTGANLTVTPANLTVMYTANPLASIYGNAPGALGGSVGAAGLVLGQTLGSVTSGTAAFGTAANATSNVGTYAITGSGLAANSSNYTFDFVQAAANASALTIGQRALTLTADPLSRVYGSANSISDTATAAAATATTGLVNGNSVSSETVTSPATSGSGVGSYALNGSAAQFGAGLASNYAITYASNLTGLAITPAAATITYAANPLSSIYGNVPTGLSGTESAAGLVNGDTLGSVTSGTVSFATVATALSNVGSYAVNGSGLAGSTGNYTFNFVQAAGNATALTIVQRALTLTADPVSRVYGGTNPTSDTATAALATATTGLVNDDSVGSETVTSPATSGSGVGSYALNGSAAQFGSGLASNYVITYASNLTGLTITPAAATITYVANPLSSIYGNVPTGLSGTESAVGLVNGDTLGSITSGTASFASEATGLSNVGSYAITGSGLAGSTGNYTFNFVQAAGNAAALTIVQRALTLTADPVSRVYGGANPISDTAAAAAANSTTGLVNGDSISSETVTSPATSASGVGSYALNGSVAQFGSGLASNYAITYASNPTGLAITPAAATITYVANPASSIYGNVPTGLSGTESAAGLVNGDTLGSVTNGTASFAAIATGQSAVGSYAVTGSGLAGSTGNYTFNFVQAAGNATALTIGQRALTLTADPMSRVYGSANPTSDTAAAALATATTGLVNGDSIDTETVTSPATVGSGVGSYALNGSAAQFGSGLASNYVITYASNLTGLTISPAALTLTYTANPGSSIYGQTPVGLTGGTALVGLVNGDTAAGVTSGTALWTGPATATSNVGSYAINGAGIGLTSGNYVLTSVQAPGNATALTINPAALSIIYTASSASRTYGAQNPLLTGTETATGLVNDDTLGSVTSGAATFTSAAEATANVGSYAITGAGLVGSSLNYTYSFAQAAGNATALAITPAAATITYIANPLSSTYGNVPTGLSGTESASGLVNGDTLGSVTSGTASYATTAGATNNTGAYAVIGSGLLANSGNYSLSFAQAPGNATALTIVPRPITVTANPQQRPVGGADPLFTYVVTGPGESPLPGLVNGDSLTGQLTSTATIGSPAGRYAIVQGTLAASGNYQLTYVGNILTLAFAAIPIADVSALIEANLPDQPGIGTLEQRKKQAAADLAALYSSLGLYPLQLAQSMINDQPVTTPAPVNEPVTSNGNSSLWSPKAP